MTTIELSAINPMAAQKIGQLRIPQYHQDRHRFYDNIFNLGSLIGYEIAKTLKYREIKISSPLGNAIAKELADQVVVAGIMRAAQPLQRGICEVFEQSDQAFIGARRLEQGSEVSVDLSYIAGPDLNGKTLILTDTMLATGKSLVSSYEALIEKLGKPKKLIIANIIASKPGLDYVSDRLPDASLYVGIIDPKLNSQSYIVPGLGDAGDILFGEKV